MVRAEKCLPDPSPNNDEVKRRVLAFAPKKILCYFLLMENRLSKRIEQAIKEKVLPGCVIGLIKKDGNKKILPFGTFTYEDQAESVKENTIYDIASLTKTVAGSCLLLKLTEDRKINLDDKVVDFIPEFGNYENKKEVTIKHLLTYTLDLEIPSMATLKDLSPEELISVVIKAPLQKDSGTSHLYTNSTAALFSLVIEKVTGKTVDKFAEETFFEPLEMKRTTFNPLNKFSKNEIAPTEFDEKRGGLIQGIVHDESSYAVSKIKSVSVAGLFSTVPDLLNFLEMILNKGEYKGKRVLSEKSIEMMFENHLDYLNLKGGLGWEMNDKNYMSDNCSDNAIGFRGFTGCTLIVDIERGMAMAMLSNMIHPKRPADRSAINNIRKYVANIVFSGE